MHIMIISACEKKAWPRTRKILDSYARRVGERSWSTPITMEGLGELHALLKSSATRQSAVACYRNDGQQRMNLLWTIGSKSAFGSDGFMPVAYTCQKQNVVPAWVSDVSLLAQGAGYLHDWGKSGIDFQTMVRSVVNSGDFTTIHRDPVRHEWLSYCLVNEARCNGFEMAWEGLNTPSKIQNCESIKSGLVDRNTVYDYLILSHHKLLGSQDTPGINASGHIKSQIPVGGMKPKGPIKRELYEKSIRQLSRVSDERSVEAWQPLATLSRAALILADHYISSINYQERFGQASLDLAANTKTNRDDSVRLDQPLNWHLESVGDKAGEIARNMAMQSYEPLSKLTVDRIMEPSIHSRFVWQDRAVAFLRKNTESKRRQVLVLNTAGTGAGKTRGNAKIACALNDKPRFCIALNLRSLTLQTGDSLRDDLGIMESELAVVIGDKISERLHRSMPDAFNTDGSDNLEIDVMSPDQELPHWLKPLATKGRSADLIVPPVLVSTVDFLISASEPGRQGHHALALLRAMNSDLILDELDSYDPKAMVAVLRLVQTSAMLGRNVICSSATISLPVARAVHQAFMSGHKMFKAFSGESPEPLTVMIDDLQDPTAFETGQFDDWVTDRHKGLITKLAEKPVYRMPTIVRPATMDEPGYIKTIIESVKRLHHDHSWNIDDRRRASFGLIRIANIGNAMKVAQAISKEYEREGKPIRIACYHANELRIQRFLKEKTLDRVLKRTGDWKARVAKESFLIDAFASSDAASIPFIVIATPVEEVGRDHDFDWAVVEPSSAQSIVQTCGRVNRHRLDPVDKPNIVLLDCNFNALRAGNATGIRSKPVFHRPGVEDARNRYSSKFISEMSPTVLDRIDAGFRLGVTQMGCDEDRVINNQLSEGMDILLKTEGNEAMWMSRYFYEKFCLRASSHKARYRFIRRDGEFNLQILRNPKKEYFWDKTDFASTPRVSNDWLTWTNDELYEACLDADINPLDGMSIDLTVYGNEEQARLVWDSSFGFRLEYS